MDIQPRHVICVLGRWSDFSDVRAAINSCGHDFTFDEQFSQLLPDERMTTAFEASVDRSDPTITDKDWKDIQSHTAVAYLLSPPIRAQDAESISGRALQLIATLLNNGGLAAKSESAGLAHGRSRWVDLSRKYSDATSIGDLHAASATLYWTWVQRAIHDESTATLYSVGMHLLGHRDTEVEDSLELSTAIEWIDLMGLYLLADKPTRPVADGNGFRLSEDGPRRIIRQAACYRYEDDDFFYNPYGYNRLVPDDASCQTD